MLMLFRDSGDNYQNVVHVTEYTNTGLIEGNFMHKEATSSLRMQTASPGFVSHPSPHPATGRPKLKRRSETQHPAPCAPRKSHKTPLRRRLPLPSRLVSHLPSASLGHDTDRKNRVAPSSSTAFSNTRFHARNTARRTLRQYAQEQGKRWQESPQGKERERVRC